jgi:mannosyltransferase
VTQNPKGLEGPSGLFCRVKYFHNMLTLETPKTFLPKNRRVIAALISIVLLGALLRFSGLDHESLWNDELERYRAGNQIDLFHTIKFGISYDTHPPLFRVLMYFTERIIGTSEAALRFPSALAGILAIGAIFFLARQLYSDREGLIAALLMAVLWCPLYYSQDAGPYPLIILFSLITLMLWRRLVDQLRHAVFPSRRLVFSYMGAAIITCYLHYFGLFLIGLQGLAALWIIRARRQKLKSAFSLYLVILAAFLPWIPVTLRFLHPVAFITRPVYLLASFVEYIEFFFNQSAILTLIVVGLTALAFLPTVFRRLKQRESFQIDLWSPTPLLIAWLIVPFVIIFCVSQFLPMLVFRYMLIALPAAYLLLARSITRLTARFTPIGQAALSIALAAAFMYNLLVVDQNYTQPHKDQFREAAASVVQRADLYPQAYILSYAYGNYFNYYFQHFGSSARVDLNLYSNDQVPAVSAALERVQPKYIWLISGFIEPNDGLLNYLDQNYQLIDQQPFLHAGVWLYQKKPS